LGARSEGGRGGPPVRATGDSFSSRSGWGLHLLSCVGSSPSSDGGGPPGSAMSGSVRLSGDDPSSAVGLAHSPLAPASASDSRAASARLASDPRRLRPGAQAVSCCLRARLHEVPGCSYASAPSRSWLGPTSACFLPEERILFRCYGLACDASVRRPVGSPSAVVPTARPRRTTFHPHKDVEEPEPCLSRGARKWGVWGRGDGRGVGGP
jgi:hypothetical protein